ncbi:MAG TPA: response regulator [Methanoregula sp.]|nr:response regulator [Methanoregula sp.]
MSPEDCTQSNPHEDTDHPVLLSILYVDDEPAFLEIGKILLARYGISVTTAASVREALPLLESGRFDVILSDYQMPIIDGNGFLRILREKKISTPVVIFTGMNPDEVLFRAVSNGAMFFAQKKGDPRTMFANLARTIQEASSKSGSKESLRETELRYKTLFECSGTAIVTMDDNLVIATANSQFRNLTGYDNDEIEGVLPLTDFIHRSDAGRLIEHIHYLREGRASPIKDIAFQLITKDRQIRPMLASVSIVPESRWSVATFIEVWRSPFSEDRCQQPPSTRPVSR